MVELSEAARQFVITYRTRAQAAEERDYKASWKQRVRVICQVGLVLEDKEHRLSVLQAITGLPIATQVNLGGVEHSLLIELTDGGKQDDVLREIESVLEAGVVATPWTLFSEIWQEAARLPPV